LGRIVETKDIGEEGSWIKIPGSSEGKTFREGKIKRGKVPIGRLCFVQAVQQEIRNEALGDKGGYQKKTQSREREPRKPKFVGTLIRDLTPKF